MSASSCPQHVDCVLPLVRALASLQCTPVGLQGLLPRALGLRVCWALGLGFGGLRVLGFRVWGFAGKTQHTKILNWH